MPAQSRAVTAAFSLILVVALLLVGRSLYLIRDMARPIPYWDAWEFMKALPAITTGRYTLADLFGFHNEHRIVTTRLIMMADLWLFDQSGYLPTGILAVALCSIGLILSFVACGRGWEGAGTAAVAASLMLSVAHWENYASGFQVQFPLVDLFAIASIGLFALASRPGRWAWALLAAAILADALAIGSMASGNVIVGPVLLVGLIQRTPWLRVVGFAAPALAFSAAYAMHYPHASTPPSHDVVGIVLFATSFLGGTLRGYPGVSLYLGAALLCGYGAHLIRLLQGWRLRRSIDPVQAWLIGIGAFVICNALVTAVGRLPLGMETATSSRYAIQSLLFVCCVFLLSWRAAATWRRSTASRLALAVGALALSTSSTLAQGPLSEWRARVAEYDVAGMAVVNGVWSDGALALVYPHPEMVRAPLRFMAAHRLGPFSNRFATIYRPPINAMDMVGTPVSSCVGIADSVRAVGPDWLQINGWVVDPVHPLQDGWVLIYDDNRHLLGFGRQSEQRQDAADSVPVVPTRLGYHLLLNLSGFDREAIGPATLVLLPKGPAGEACTFRLSLGGAG